MLVDHVVASTVAGLASTLLGHPLDTIKTHLQTQTQPQAAWRVLTTLRWGVFRGMGPPLVNAIVMNTIMFSVFDSFHATFQNPFAAGLVSGFATAMVSTPTDYLKIRSQLDATSTASSSWGLLRHTFQTQANPIRFLYQGHVANLGREGVFTMVYLGLYHFWLTKDNDNSVSPSLVSVALTSSLTGAMAWVVSYPFDTIKTLRQSGKNREQVWRVFERQGAKAFYKGCATSTGRAMLVTSSRMIAYECCREWMMRE